VVLQSMVLCGQPLLGDRHFLQNLHANAGCNRFCSPIYSEDNNRESKNQNNMKNHVTSRSVVRGPVASGRWPSSVLPGPSPAAICSYLHKSAQKNSFPNSAASRNKGPGRTKAQPCHYPDPLGLAGPKHRDKIRRRRQRSNDSTILSHPRLTEHEKNIRPLKIRSTRSTNGQI